MLAPLAVPTLLMVLTELTEGNDANRCLWLKIEPFKAHFFAHLNMETDTAFCPTLSSFHCICPRFLRASALR